MHLQLAGVCLGQGLKSIGNAGTLFPGRKENLQRRTMKLTDIFSHKRGEFRKLCSYGSIFTLNHYI
jgi:hypothetical protein